MASSGRVRRDHCLITTGIDQEFAMVEAGRIKHLREVTGFEMTQCKRALEEANGDMDLAIRILRKRKGGRGPSERPFPID
jgi:hypothetical protein